MIAEMLYAYVLGLLSILSPCTFIIVPVMTSNINKKITKVIGFLVGITVAFGILGILSALTGKLLTNFMGPYLYFLAGTVTLVSALDMLNVIELRLHSLFANLKIKNDFMLGIIYGGVALSCVGPLISSVLVYITTKASVIYGLIMMYVFSLGFITPFILFGFFISDKRISQKLMKHSALIRRIGGIMLLLVSIYLFFIGFSGVI